MKAKQEEQARQMVELQQENEHVRARLEGELIENARGSDHPAPLVKQNKGKDPIRLEGSNTATGDELSFGSSTLPDLTPPKNNAKVESRKRPLRRSSRFSAASPFGCGENLAEKGGNWSAPPRTCPRG